MNCEYIFRCSYKHKGKEPMCKNNHVSCNCDYWQGLKAEDVKVASDLITSGLEGEVEKSSFLDHYYNLDE